VLLDQVADQGLGASAIICGDDVVMRLVGGAGDEHDRESRREQRELV
jgi:hypothetical protein